MRAYRKISMVLLGLVAAGEAWANCAPVDDAKLQSLSQARGCNVCHGYRFHSYGSTSDSVYAPRYSDIATKYKDDPNAEERLARVVLKGSSKNLSDLHWRGSVALTDMPDNLSQVSPDEARDIVRWILRSGCD